MVCFRTFAAALGVKLAAGRAFSAAEGRPGAGIRVAIVGYDRWENAGFDPTLLGRAITINAQDFTIVGVAPAGFTGTIALIAPDVWLPLSVFDTVVNDILPRVDLVTDLKAGAGSRGSTALSALRTPECPRHRPDRAVAGAAD